MDRLVPRFLPVRDGQPHRTDKEHQPAGDQHNERAPEKRQVAVVVLPPLIELILDRIGRIHCSRENDLCISVRPAAPERRPLAGRTHIHVGLKVPQLRADDQVPYIFPGLQILNMCLRVRIPLIIRPVRIDLLRFFINIDIGKVCIAFLHPVPAVLILYTVIVNVGKSHGDTFIDCGKLSVHILRSVHHFQQVLRAGRRITLPQGLPEIPAVRIHFRALAVIDPQLIAAGVGKPPFLKLLQECRLVLGRIRKFDPHLPALETAQEIIQIIIIVAPVRTPAHDHFIVAVER